MKAVPEAVLSEPLFCESELLDAEPPQPVSAVASIAPARSILSVFFMVKSSPLFPPNQHILSGVLDYASHYTTISAFRRTFFVLRIQFQIIY